MPLRLALRAGLLVLASSLPALPAVATTVFINDPTAQVTGIGNLVMGAKYRLSNTNFDQSLDSGGGTQGSNTISTNLGNLAALNNVTYSFQLRNIAGQGLVFSMTGPGNVTRTLAWGQFSPALSPAPTVAAATLAATAATGQPVGTPLAPGDLRMNAIHLEAVARQRSGTSYVPTVSLSGLQYSAPGQALRGTLIPAQAATNTSLLTNANFPEVGPGFASQWLLTRGDFWAFDWTLSGDVNLALSTTSGVGNVDEFVKFTVSGKEVTFVGGVPEPSAWALLIAGFGLVGGVARRRRWAALPAGARHPGA